MKSKSYAVLTIFQYVEPSFQLLPRIGGFRISFSSKRTQRELTKSRFDEWLLQLSFPSDFLPFTYNLNEYFSLDNIS